MEGFNFERCFYEVMKNLTDSEIYELVNAMCEYKFRNQDPEFATERLAIMWPLVKYVLDQSDECEYGDE